MEEVRRVTTTRKPKRTTIILLTLVGLLGLGLIGAAIYFYAIGDSAKKDDITETTCACYYIDPTVVSECGDPRRGFLFETATVSGDAICKAPCATNKLSVNLLNSSTQQDLYQICQLQTVQDKRCSEMTIKDGDGKIVTGKVSPTDEVTVEAKFDKEYTGHKFLINNQEVEPDVISPDKLTIKKDITELDISTLSIVAVAIDSTGEQINSPLCRRLIEIEQEGTSNLSSIQFEKRKEEKIYKISKVRISIGNITNDSDLTIRFSFEGKLTDLIMNDGYTIDAAKGEVTILEQELYNAENFGTAISFSQLDGATGKIDLTVEVRDENGVIGSIEGSFDFPEVQTNDEEEELTEESDFTVSKSSNLECIERVSPNNIAQFTLTSASRSSVAQNITSIKDKLPLGFTYVENSSKINGVSITDTEYVTITEVGNTEEIVWQKENGWDINAGQSLVIVFQAQAGANALTGSNQNEVIVTPKEVPADPTSLRAEYVIQVAQDCEDPNAPTTETPTTESETPTTPSTGIFDSALGRIVAGVITILVGWYIYSRPLAQIAIQKLIDSGVYKEVEIASWKIFRPKKYFEAKILKKIRKGKR